MLVAALIADLVLARLVLGRRGPTAWALDAIAGIERRLNRPHRPPADRRLRGALVLLALTLAAGLAGAALDALTLTRGSGGMRLLHLLMVLSLLEVGGPPAEAQAEATKPTAADHRTARGAVERLALRLAEGAIGPLTAYLLLGLGGLAAWRAIVLLERGLAGHAPFDAAAIRAYRLLLMPASLLAGTSLAVAAIAIPGASPFGAVAAMRGAPLSLAARAAMAGAFGWSLGDGRGGWLGAKDGRARLTAEDIRRAAAAHSIAVVTVAAGLVLLAVLL